MLLSYIFGPILSNDRRSKLHAVIDCLFFFFTLAIFSHFLVVKISPVFTSDAGIRAGTLSCVN